MVRRTKVTFHPSVSDPCTQHPSSCLQQNTIELGTRQAKDRPEEEGIREMSSRDRRTSDSRLKVVILLNGNRPI